MDPGDPIDDVDKFLIFVLKMKRLIAEAENRSGFLAEWYRTDEARAFWKYPIALSSFAYLVGFVDDDILDWAGIERYMRLMERSKNGL